MSNYKPGLVPDKPDVVPAFLREELARLAREIGNAQQFLELQVLHVAPVKTRPGMLVYADGTDWNPGSGEGVYRRNKANSSWAFLG